MSVGVSAADPGVADVSAAAPALHECCCMTWAKGRGSRPRGVRGGRPAGQAGPGAARPAANSPPDSMCDNMQCELEDNKEAPGPGPGGPQTHRAHP